MLKGAPQTLTSKFKISYNLLLNLVDIGDANLSQFAKKSMITEDIDKESQHVSSQLNSVNSEITKLTDSISYIKTPIEVVNEYIQLLIEKPTSVNKKRKEIERKIQQIVDNYKTIENDKLIVQKYKQKIDESHDITKELEQLQKYTDTKVNIILDLLLIEGFVERKAEELIALTEKGKFATHLREINCLVFASFVQKGIFENVTSKQLVSIFSCFTNLTVNEELKAIVPSSQDKQVQNIVCEIQDMFNYYSKKETDYQINTGTDYNIHFDLMDYVIQWCDCDCIEDCKFFLQNLETEKEIFLGEFVKAILKINNISNEMEKIAEITGNIALLSKLREISNLTLKFVVTNQSLYV
jgi:superfamily II RNA helicase